MKDEAFTKPTTVRLLDQWKTKTSTESDYKAAKTLGITQSTISGWRHGRSHAKPALAARMARDLGLDEMAVLAAIEADRAHDGDDRRTWQKHGRAAFIALTMGVCLPVLVQATPRLQQPVYEQTRPLCEIKDGEPQRANRQYSTCAIGPQLHLERMSFNGCFEERNT